MRHRLPSLRARPTMLVLFDRSTLSGIARALVGHTVGDARERGWDQVSNGDLLNATEAAGFQVLLTTDKNIQYQQNLAGRQFCFGAWELRVAGSAFASRGQHCRCGESGKPGGYTEVEIPNR